jgi:hypothetical protein
MQPKQDVGFYLFERARSWVNTVPFVPCYPLIRDPQLGTPYPMSPHLRVKEEAASPLNSRGVAADNTEGAQPHPPLPRRRWCRRPLGSRASSPRRSGRRVSGRGTIDATPPAAPLFPKTDKAPEWVRNDLDLVAAWALDRFITISETDARRRRCLEPLTARSSSTTRSGLLARHPTPARARPPLGLRSRRRHWPPRHSASPSRRWSGYVASGRQLPDKAAATL